MNEVIKFAAPGKAQTDKPDFILISGDAFIDHHSFGAALIARYIQSLGHSINILTQPDWKNPESFAAAGSPKYAVLITAGNIDSMVCHYTSSRKKRSSDAYTPGGHTGHRPDRASITYSTCARQAFKGKPVILGGIEASLRRLAHYDYWQDKVRKSVLLDSKADLLIYGMGEHAIKEICTRFTDAETNNQEVSLHNIRGTAHTIKENQIPEEAIILPDFEQISKPTPESKHQYAESIMIQYKNTDPITAKPLVEPYNGRFLLQNPPQLPLTTEEMDEIYALPFTDKQADCYNEEIPALKEVKYSITSSRGCFGSCNFCALTFHQGRQISARSHNSILQEAEAFTKEKDFKGIIHDVGGPTANFRSNPCSKMQNKGACSNRSCLAPEMCPNVKPNHSEYLQLLRKLRKIPGIRKVFIRSGIRFDFMLADKSDDFFRELCEHHVSGQLKVAPEHHSDKVLKYMNKPSSRIYREFRDKFFQINKELDKKQFLIPYYISGHPGSTLQDAIELALYLKQTGFIPDQVQDFYPTPGSISTCMYYTELDPFTMKKIHVPKNNSEKSLQRALLHFHKPENRGKVITALKQAGRTDLIGPKGLIKSEHGSQHKQGKKHAHNSNRNRSRKKPRR